MAFIRRYWSSLSTEAAADLLLNAVTVAGAGGTMAYAISRGWPEPKYDDWLRCDADDDERCQDNIYRLKSAAAFIAGGIGFRYGSMVGIGAVLTAADFCKPPYLIGLGGVVAAAAVGWQAGHWMKNRSAVRKQRKVAAYERPYGKKSQ